MPWRLLCLTVYAAPDTWLCTLPCRGSRGHVLTDTSSRPQPVSTWGQDSGASGQHPLQKGLHSPRTTRGPPLFPETSHPPRSSKHSPGRDLALGLWASSAQGVAGMVDREAGDQVGGSVSQNTPTTGPQVGRTISERVWGQLAGGTVIPGRAGTLTLGKPKPLGDAKPLSPPCGPPGPMDPRSWAWGVRSWTSPPGVSSTGVPAACPASRPAPSSSCPQLFPASGSFPTSGPFASLPGLSLSPATLAHPVPGPLGAAELASSP